MALERPATALPPGLWRDLSATHIGNGAVAFLFAATGPVAVVLATGTKGGLSEAELASWVFGAFFINGIISIVYCLAYRQPLAFFWTIPGTVLVGPALTHLSFPEVIGAFLATGFLMIALGLTGWVRRAMEAIPMPIVMGMVAGVFLSFGLDWVRAFETGFWIAAPMTAVYLLVSVSPVIAARVPPLIAALAVGALAVWQTGAFAPGLDAAAVLAAPQIRAPAFSWPAMLELVVPLAITVLVVQNGQGMAVLTAAGHAAPINSVAVACGVGTLASAVVGAAPTCLTGPVNAIISAGGARHTQYAAGVVVGVLAMLFGLLSPLFTRLLLAAPAAFIATLAGLAMLRVLQSAFAIAFQGRFTLGALVTFLVTVAGIPVLNIGAPFWALIAGALVSLMLERGDWRSAGATNDTLLRLPHSAGAPVMLKPQIQATVRLDDPRRSPMTTRRAACSCGQLALTIEGEPVRVSMCHCLECQRRTGAVISNQARFRREQIAVTGEATAWTRSSASGNALTFRFCPVCGSTVYWEGESFPGLVAVAIGTFADPDFPAPAVSVWEETRHSWVSPPADPATKRVPRQG